MLVQSFTLCDFQPAGKCDILGQGSQNLEVLLPPSPQLYRLPKSEVLHTIAGFCQAVR
jgi:hypothetical protein